MARDKIHALGDALGDAVHCAINAQSELREIAYVLSYLGPDKIALQLDRIGDALVARTKAAQGAYSIQLNDDLASSQAFTGLLLKATLEGCLQPSKRAAKSTA